MGRTQGSDGGTIRDGDVTIEGPVNQPESLIRYGGTSGGASASGGTEHVVETVVERTVVEPAAGGAVPAPAADAGVGSVMATTPGRASTDVFAGDENGPLAQVHEAMKVVDADGDEVGKVSYVKMGDPEAATTQGQSMDTGAGDVALFGGAGTAGNTAGTGSGGMGSGGVGIGGLGLGGGDEPAVAEPLRSQLLRSGFVKVDGKGWFGSDHYLSADMIRGVSGDTVTLNVPKAMIPKQ